MTSYAHSAGVLLPLSALFPAPPQWRETFSGIAAARPKLDAILRRMRNGDLLPPVCVRFGSDRSRFAVIDGLHRTYASLELGFDQIPAVETTAC
jgi:ParB-like chromosome segregation protein Spo0J